MFQFLLALVLLGEVAAFRGDGGDHGHDFHGRGHHVASGGGGGKGGGGKGGGGGRGGGGGGGKGGGKGHG